MPGDFALYPSSPPGCLRTAKTSEPSSLVRSENPDLPSCGVSTGEPVKTLCEKKTAPSLKYGRTLSETDQEIRKARTYICHMAALIYNFLLPQFPFLVWLTVRSEVVFFDALATLGVKKAVLTLTICFFHLRQFLFVSLLSTRFFS